MSETNLSAFLWSVADLLRGAFKQSDYRKVILPFTVLRRLDCDAEGIVDVNATDQVPSARPRAPGSRVGRPDRTPCPGRVSWEAP